jgi:hypothetical protein
MGFAAVVAIRGADGFHITAAVNGRDSDPPGAKELVEARWWCRRPEEAARVAAAATARLQRRQSRELRTHLAAADSLLRPSDISAAIESAAGRLHIALYSDEEISIDAERIIARVDEEIASLRRAGQLKSVNRSYRTYRMEAVERGERTAPYAVWFNKYTANLVRELAAALRYS